MITPHMAAVLKVFLEDPSRSRHGTEITRLTGLRPGTLYPLLATLEEAGWLVRENEEGDPRELGRPLRKPYTIVPAAVERAREELESLSRHYMPPPAVSRHYPQAGASDAVTQWREELGYDPITGEVLS
jgi:PadR family transcriptional regulator, regulatory protein PadR